MDDIRKSILKIGGPRVHKINNSLGVYNAYKWIRKNKWLDIERPLTEHEFYSIIRHVNKLLAENLICGKDIVFPEQMGSLELRKYDAKISLNNGVLKTNLPIDWDKTLKLWTEDQEAYNGKVLVRAEEKEIFTVFFNRRKATFNNKSFYEFKVNRDLKKRLKQRIKSGAIDAFKLHE